MSNCCSEGCTSDKPVADKRYRRILWIAMVINMVMFGIEFAGGLKADSVSLLADAIDFLGDAGNYALSLFVLGMATIWRSRAAFLKGIAMGTYGVLVLGKAGWSAAIGTMPEAATMGLIGFLALLANALVGWLLYTYRNGDANMRSVWLCTRNDAIGNVAVMLAALGVSGTSRGWPDVAVAVLMGVLAISAACSVIAQSWNEIQLSRVSPSR